MSRIRFPRLSNPVIWDTRHEWDCSYYKTLHNPTKFRTTKTPFCTFYWKRQPPCNKNNKRCPHMKQDMCGNCIEFNLLKGGSFFCTVIGKNVHPFEDACNYFK